jgi:uncharacterized protein YhbP (UPF0306 family)
MTNPTQDFLTKVRRYLASHSTLTLATVNPAGQPEAAPLFFAVDDDTLIFLSGAKSRHSANVAAEGRAAVAVYGETWDWREIAGLQMEGIVSLVPAGHGRARAWEVYKAKFPFVVEFETEVSRSEFYRFEPHWIRLIDNSVSFGFREEINLRPDAAR